MLPTERGYGDDFKSWKALIPKNPAGVPDGSWIRPPFRSFVIASTRDEQGCLFVQEVSLDRVVETEAGERVVVVSPGYAFRESEDALWSVTIDMIVEAADGRFCLGGTSSVTCTKQGSLRTPGTEQHQASMAHAVRARGSTLELAPTPADALVQLGDPRVVSSLADCADSIAVATMALLCCKNVERREVLPPRQQRRLAERRGSPLVSWHELLVRPLGATRAVGTSGDGEPLALHWVRGHFKDYRERGLFGSVKGVFWWSPHIAGRAEHVVLKDYRLGSLT